MHQRIPSRQLGQLGALMQSGRWADLRREIEGLRKRFPGDPELLRLAGIASHKLGETERGLRELEAAMAHHPDPATCEINLASILRRSGRPDRARERFRSALERDPRREAAWYNLGLLEQQEARAEAAADCFTRALALDDRRAASWMGLGHARKALGDVDGAAEAYRRGLDLQPRNGALWWSLANLKTCRFRNEDTKHLRELASQAPGRDDPAVHFALGKALEDQGREGEAFGAYQQGNALQRRRVSYDAEARLDLGRRIRESFDAAQLARRGQAPVGDASPIFVVSLPRSGSTLVEQIISSHPDVTGASELPDLGQVALSALGTGASGQWAPEKIRELDAAALRALGEAYMTRTRRWQQRRRFTDKQPANFALVGLIALTLPGARVINVRRDPRDIGLSCFRQLFNRGHHWSYRLEDIASHYRFYDELIRYWQESLPDLVMEVQYEQLVDQPERETRRMLDFCGLEFDPACLAFERNARAVRTASAGQVRQGLNRDSIGRWRTHADRLAPLIDRLPPDSP